MITVNELRDALNALNPQIKKILEEVSFRDNDDLSTVEGNREDAEDRFLLTEFRNILDRLDDVSRGLDYLRQPIEEEGVLRLGSDGRYHMGDRTFTSGSTLEVLVPVEDYVMGEWISCPEWVASRIEHDGEKYYLVGYHDINLVGLNARLRKWW